MDRQRQFPSRRRASFGLPLLFALALSAIAAELSAAAPNAGAPCVTRQELSARSPGILHKVRVRDGQRVKPGDVLVELDSRQQRAGLKEAQGATDAARGNEELAVDAYARLSKLKGGDSVSEQQLLEAKVRAAQAKAVRQQAEGATERVKVLLDDTIFRAEVKGVIRGVPTTLGMAVSPGQSLGRVEADQEHCPKEGAPQ